MKARADLFRTYASECAAAAQNAKDQNIRQDYLELMGGWHELANQVESFRPRAVAGAKPRIVRTYRPRLDDAYALFLHEKEILVARQ